MSEPVSLSRRAGGRSPVGGEVLLYDGECGFCQRTVRWLLRRDLRATLWFAPQQLPAAAAALARHGVAAETLNAAVLISSFDAPGERITVGADAVLKAVGLLGGPWEVLAWFARLVPRVVRDTVYRLIARNRLRLFPAAMQCDLPTPNERRQFLAS